MAPVEPSWEATGQRCGARTLSWSAPVRAHDAVEQVRAELLGSLSARASPRCAIRVWVDGHDSCAPLARASGSVCPKNGRRSLHVHWVERQRECPCTCKSALDWYRVTDEVTIAQALLGLLAVVGMRLGMGSVTLGAEDNGSGKLTRYYEDLGFAVLEGKIKARTSSGSCDDESGSDVAPSGQRRRRRRGDEVCMVAPIAAVARLAPVAWIAALVPPDFDAWSWFWGDVEKPTLQDMLHRLGAPRRWSWPVHLPPCTAATVEMQVDNAGQRLVFDVRLSDRSGAEVAFARGAARLLTRALRILWLGRSGGRGLPPDLRGRRLADAPDGGGDVDATVAISLLGVLAAMGLWLGVGTLELNALDDGSGALVRHLQRFGFQPETCACAQGPTPLKADAEKLVARCLPSAWRDEHLPRPGELSVLASGAARA